MRISSSGSVFPLLKPLVVVLGVLRVFLLLGIYHLYRHKCHQEWILPVGLHLNIQYLGTIRGNQVIGKILRSGVTFSYFLQF